MTRSQLALIDRLEQAVITVLWLWFAYRIYESSSPFAPLLLISEISVAVFVLVRRPTLNVSTRLSDWGLACAATALPLLAEPTNGEGFVVAGMLFYLAGLLWQLGAKFFLRRSFGVAPANRGIVTSGPYRFMRHPIYAGYLSTHIGILLLMPSLWNLTVYGAAWAVQVLRLLAEERLLGEDPDYRSYQQKVPARLVPGVF
ncbi:isoprenylcysteine carboxylmethyltransferase family protein [Alsobacter sp. SYSU M60028]|uniref:Isoprenylcysteine carboxylmethyltransferase family protein n=1 Tax=Alsobacter ponti TaxID=2962936 RepID=A0ABT1LHI7_9HYPH|nr:methyltransferase [Alsobacter ponti]MCP8940899.1 isoprenylcysteine carboxylmethyltransferase family protein [Alsobacter ponti]